MCVYFLHSFFWISWKSWDFGAVTLFLSLCICTIVRFIYIYICAQLEFSKMNVLSVCVAFFFLLLLYRLFAQYTTNCEPFTKYSRNICLSFSLKNSSFVFVYGRILVCVTYIIIPVTRWSSKRISFIILLFGIIYKRLFNLVEMLASIHTNEEERKKRATCLTK